jgi:HEPN superfamily AbiU2-like protein
METMTDDLQTKWRSWLDPDHRLPNWTRNLWDEFYALGLRRDVWRGYRDIVAASTEEARSAARWLTGVVTRNHVEAQVMALRRLADEGHHPDIVSFARLLTEVADHPEILGADIAAEARRDLEEMRARVDPVKRFADKQVAHFDQNHGTAVPATTFAELDDVIDFIGELWVRWYVRVTGISTTAKATPQFDWSDRLRLEVIDPSWTDDE